MRVAPVEVGIVSPDPINRVVVVADGIFDGTAVRGYTAEREIDGAILRGTLPKSEQVRLGFIKTARVAAIAECAGEAELVLRVGGIQAESGAEFVNRTVKVARIYVCQALYIELAAEGSLVGVKASNEVADHGERRNRGHHKNDQNERSGRRKLGGRPLHISRTTISFAKC